MIRSAALAACLICATHSPSRAQQFEGLGDLPGGSAYSAATGVSGNGSVVVGISESASGTEAFSWTAGGGMVGLGDLAGGSFYSYAHGVSSDGSVIVGRSASASGSEAFSWTAGGGMVGLGDLAGGSFYSEAYDVSAHGSVVVGLSRSASGNEAFRWTAGGGMVGLGDLTGGGFYSTARGVSDDGAVVVGTSESASGYEAFRWTAGGGMVGLGDLAGGGFYSEARGVNGDGSVVVGRSETASGYEAFRWTAGDGMQSVRALLVTAGVDMTGWTPIWAYAVSTDGTTIVGSGDSPSSTTEAWIARLALNGSAGITTPAALQASTDALANSRFGLMAQHHGLASPLLGGDKRMADDSEIGVFGMGGSYAGGGFARYASGDGIAILAGVSYGEESYQNAAITESLMGALALRYLTPGASLWRPFGEVGGWLASNADLEFERTYMNGAGTATGIGKTEGDLSYIYARAGLVFDLGRHEQIVVSAEIGRERLEADAYAEAQAGNPFFAQLSSGTDRMDLAKARLAWSFAITSAIDATLWGAGVYGFNRETDFVVGVVGVGGFAPAASDDTAWAEYGARVGYAVTEQVTFDVFVNGVSGNEDIGTRVHGGGGIRYRF